MKRVLMIGVALFLSVTGRAAEFCVESKFTEVDEVAMSAVDSPLLKYHFLLTSPSFLRDARGKKLVEFEQRQVVRGHGYFDEGPVSLAPIEYTTYQSMKRDCERAGLFCTDDEIIVMYSWQRPPDPTEEGVTPPENMFGGPQLYDVVRTLYGLSGVKTDFEQAERLNRLKDVYGPRALTDGVAQRSQMGIRFAWEQFLKRGQQDLAAPQESDAVLEALLEQMMAGEQRAQAVPASRMSFPQHDYFHANFPQPQLIVIELGKTQPVGDKEYLTLTDVQYVMNIKLTHRLLSSIAGITLSLTEKWCLSPNDERRPNLSEIIRKPDLTISYRPTPMMSTPAAPISEDGQDGPEEPPTEEGALPPAVPAIESAATSESSERVEASVFSALIYPHVLENEEDWNRAWLINTLAQIQRAEFLDLKIPVLDQRSREQDGVNSPLKPQSYFNALMIALNSEDGREWFQKTQTWSNTAYELIKDGAVQQLIEKSLDVEADSQEGKIIRAYEAYGSKIENQALLPAITLPKSQLVDIFPQLRDVSEGVRYLVGFKDMHQFVRMGIHNLAQNLFESRLENPDALTLEIAQERQLSRRDREQWDYVAWLFPSMLTPFGIHAELDPWRYPLRFMGSIRGAGYIGVEQRWNDQSRPLLVKPEDWVALTRFIRSLANFVSDGAQGTLDARGHLEAALRLFCQQPAQTPQTQQRAQMPFICSFGADRVAAFYFGLALLDNLLVVRLEFGQPETEGADPSVALTFEKLGVLKESNESLGAHQKMVYANTWLGQRVSFEGFLRKLLDERTFESFRLASFVSLIQQTPPTFVRPHVAQSYTFYDQPDHVVYTFLRENEDTGQIELDVSVQPKDNPAETPRELSLPPSCTTFRGETVFPQTVKVESFAVPNEVSESEKLTFTTVACGSGEILFFVNERPLSCGEEGKQWQFHEALFLHEQFEDFNNSYNHTVYFPNYLSEQEVRATEATETSAAIRAHWALEESLVRAPYTTDENINGFVRNLLCKTSGQWASTEPKSFKYILSSTLASMQRDGFSPLRFVRSQFERDESERRAHKIRVFLTSADGAIYQIVFTHRMGRTDQENFWSLSVPVSPKLSSEQSPVHFRHDINPFSYAAARAQFNFVLGAPTDLVVSRKLSPQTLQAIKTQLAGDAANNAIDAQDSVDECRVVGENTFFDRDEAAVYVAFLLSSSGSSFTSGQHYLTKLVWLPDVRLTSDAPPDLVPCSALVKKILGHGLTLPLNLTLAHELRAVYVDEENTHPDIPHLIVNGAGDGGLAIFNPEALLGIKLIGEETEPWFTRWAKSIMRFAANTYFFFGHRSAQKEEPAQWYEHSTQGACVAFPRDVFRDGVLGSSGLQMDSCSPFVDPDTLSEFERQAAADEQATDYAHAIFHLYSSDEDDHVLLRQGPQLLSERMQASEEAVGSELLAFSSDPPEVVKKYPAFYNPVSGAMRLAQFSAQSIVSLPPQVVLPERSAQHLLNEVISRANEDNLKTPITDYWVDALKRYFCSFLTVYQGMDQLKVNPRSGEGDLPFYELDIEQNGEMVKQKSLHLYRGDTKVIIDAEESSNPFDCTDLKADGNLAYSQSVLQLKVSAMDQWQDGMPLTDPVAIAYKNQLQAVERQLVQQGDEGRLAIKVARRVRSYLLAGTFTDAVATAQVSHLKSKSMTRSQFNTHLRQVLRELLSQYGRDSDASGQNAFLKRIQDMMKTEGFGQHIRTLARDLSGYLPEDQGDELKIKQLREAVITYFLNHYLAHVLMYTEFFAPSIKKSYERMFEGDIPTIQQALLDAVQFQDMSPTLESSVIKHLSAKMSFQTGPGSDRRPVEADAVWGKLRICNVDTTGNDLTCGHANGARELSSESKAFIPYFIKYSFGLNRKLRETDLDVAVTDYARLFIKKIYLIGVEQAGKIIPLTFFFYHQRPGLSLFSSEGKSYIDEPWGEEVTTAGMLHPFYDLSYYLDRQEGADPLAQFKAWGLSLVTQPNGRFAQYSSRVYQETADQTRPRPFEMPETPTSWTTQRVAGWLSVAPFKMAEFSSIYSSDQDECRSSEVLNERANELRTSFSDLDSRRAQGAISSQDYAGELSQLYQDVDRLVNACSRSIGIDQGYRRYHFDSFKYKTLSPAGDHWVFLNTGYRSLADLYFQAMWDKLVHIPMAQEANKRPFFEKSPFDKLFTQTHQSLHRFVHRPVGGADTGIPAYGAEHINKIWTLTQKLFEDYKASYHDKVIPYHDMLAVEVMFPMITRYVMFPKYRKEFDAVESAVACNEVGLDPQDDFDPRVRHCLEIRSKEHLLAYYKRPTYFFIPGLFENLVQDRFKELFTEFSPVEPFHVVAGLTPQQEGEDIQQPAPARGALGLSREFWLGGLNVPGFSAPGEVGDQMYGAYRNFMNTQTLPLAADCDGAGIHVWGRRGERAYADQFDMLTQLTRYLSATPYTPVGEMIFLTPSRENIPVFFTQPTASGGQLSLAAHALELKEPTIPRLRCQRYSAPGGTLLMNRSIERGRDRRAQRSHTYLFPIEDAGTRAVETHVWTGDYTARPVPEIEFNRENANRENDRLRLQGCVGSTCFDYSFMITPEHIRPLEAAHESALASAGEMQVRETILGKIAAFIDGYFDRSERAQSKYLLHVADWKVQAEKQYVAVNVIEQSNPEDRESLFRQTAFVFSFHKTSEDVWDIQTPPETYVQVNEFTRVVGPMRVEGEGEDVSICAPFIRFDVQYKIQVFVNQCSRFIDRSALEQLERLFAEGNE